MAQFFEYLRRAGLSALIAVPSVVSATAAPVQAGVAYPYNGSDTASSAAATDADPGRRGVSAAVPRLAPAGLAALKAAAAQGLGAEAADPLGRPSGGPEPLAGDVTTAFTGLDRPGAASGGLVFFPPDTTVSKSVARVLHATNSALRLSNTAGGTLATSTLNGFFGAAAAQGTLFDPKVYFDRNAVNRRFYVVALQRSGTTTAPLGRIWLAVSRSPDPANLLPASWCRYAISSVRNAGTADVSWGDYPGLGAGTDKLVVSVNNFRFSDSTFTFAIVRSFNKLIASNNAAACPRIPFHTFQPTRVSGDVAVFTLQPVQHYTAPSSFTGSTNPAYLVNTVFGASNLYRVWRINGLAPGAGSFQPVNVAGNFTYSVPPDAPQAGTALRLDTGDNRVTQAAGVGNLLTAVHATLCNLGGGAAESCNRVVRIIVGALPAPAVVTTAAISQQSTFGFPNEFYFWPGVAVNVSLQTVVPFQFVSPNRTGGRLSAWFATKDSPTSFFTSMSPITTGTCAQTLSSRTGDYVGAQLDPSDARTFWMAGERATVIGAECQWQTRIIRYDPGFPVVGFDPE